jgi:phosphoglycolate phosphatase
VGRHFSRVYGGDSFAEKKPDPVGINTLLAENASRAQDAWMVGDSGVDVQTARNAQVRACGVAWGFQPESFEKYPPDVVIQEPLEFLRVCNGIKTRRS